MACAAYFTPEQMRQSNKFDELEAKITELWGHLNAATYRFLALLAEFDREKAYGRHGLANTAQWFNWQCGIRPEAAREAETALQIPANVRAADALRYMAETFLAYHGAATGVGSGADRVQVVVHIDQAILAEQQVPATEPHRCGLEDGPALALDTARRLACDATIVGIVEGEDGEPLNIGRKARAIPPALARALRARDGGCRFPGCDRRRFCHGHHIDHWADGGETKLHNLVTLCSFHHRLVHEGGYGLRRTDDGLFVFTRPDGRRVEPNGAQCFRGNILARHDLGSGRAFDDSLRDYLMKHEPGLSITSETSRCKWFGESIDYSQAIEAMQVLERKAAAAP